MKWKKHWLALWVAAAGVLMFAAPLEAAEFHVASTTGLSTALDTAETNGEADTIYLAAGTYTGNFEYRPPDSENYSLTLRGEPGTTAQDVILDGGHAGRVFGVYYFPWNPVSAFDISVQGLTIQNGDSTLESSREGGGIRATGSYFNIDVRDCIVLNNTAEGGGGGLYIWPASAWCRIENNLIYGNTTTEAFGGTSIGAGGFLYNPGGRAFFVRNNVIAGNTAQGVVSQGGGLFVHGYGTQHLIGNTIYGNQANAGGGIHFYNSSTVNVYNNIVYENAGAQGADIYFREGFVTNRVGYHNDYTGMFGAWTDSDGNIDQPPSFVNPAGNDYHLKSDSPCIDQGTNEAPELANNDMDGEPRVWDGDGDGTAVADMGADERYEAPEGTIGTVLSLTCPAMGSKKPRVYLEYERKSGKTGKKRFKVISMADSTVTCLWKKRMAEGTYDLYVRPKARGAEPISMGTFGIVGPSIDTVTPDHGAAGAIIEVAGEFFSPKKPKVYLQDPGTLKKKRCKVLDRYMDSRTGASSLSFRVPKLPAGTYLLLLRNKIGEALWGGSFDVD